MNNEPKNNRYYGLDLLRLVFIFSIICFHIHETFFYTTVNTLPFDKSFYSNLEPFFRATAFSGFGLVTLSAFLMGWISMNRRKWVILFSIFTFGAIFLGLLHTEDNQWFYFEWDIYYFLFLSFLILALIQFNLYILYFVSTLSLILLTLPIWHWDYLLNSNILLKDILIGDCTTSGKGGWPLLPWISIILIMYSLARFIKTNIKIKDQIYKLNYLELLIWFICILGLSPWLGGYYYTPFGPDFPCFVHRRPPIEFWSQWIIVLFLIRISFLDLINNYLKKSRLVFILSSLYWNQYLGLCYAIHFIFLNIGYNYREYYLGVPYLIDIYVLILFIGVELSSRLVVYLIGKAYLKKEIH